MRDVNLVKENISRMIGLNAPESDIDQYVASEGYTPEMLQGGQQPQAPAQPQEQQQADAAYLAENKPVFDGTLGAIENRGRGYNLGMGNMVIGLAQTATDIIDHFYPQGKAGEVGARLAQAVTERKRQQTLLPSAQRQGVTVGEIINPELVVGGGTALKIANAGFKGAKITGLTVGSAINAGFTGFTSPQEQTGLGNRVEEAGKGAAIGGLVGGGLGLGIKAVVGVGKVGKALFTVRKPEDILAARLPKEQTLELLEQLKTASPDSPVVLPDIAGDSIKGLTRSIAKISTGRDIITDALENRSQRAITRVADHLSKDISPVGAYFGNIDDLVKARSEVSKPLYDKVFGNTTVDASKKEELWRQAVGDSGISTPEEFQSVIKNYVEARKTLANNKEESLLQFIRSQGGISDNKGELASLGITNKTLPGFLRKEGSKGVGIDDVGEKLMEAGYFRERPTTAEVLEIIDNELRGGKINLNPVAEYARKAMEDFDRSGIDLKSLKDWQAYKPDVKTTGASLPTKGNEEFLSKIAPELKSVRNDFRLTPEEAPDNSFTLLHHVKESLFDKAQVLKRQGANSQARVYDRLRVELTKKMGEVSPDYKKANEVFGGFSQLKGAQEAGLDFSKLRPEEVRREILSLSAAERDAYRIGVRENLQKTVSSTADGADPAKRIFGNEFKREQLKAVFGNKAKFNEFEKKMATEIRAADTKAKVLGGSRTDFNMAGDEEFMNKIISGGLTAVKSKLNPLYLLEAAHNAISNKFAGINEKNAASLARIMVNRPDAINALENIIKKQSEPIQKRVLMDAKQYILTNILTQSTIQGNGNDANAAQPTEQEAMDRYKEAAPITKYIPTQQELRRILGKSNQQSKK
jgi:hypothetical protein